MARPAPTAERAERLFRLLVDDMTGRPGLAEAWAKLNRDQRGELRRAWCAAAARHFDAATKLERERWLRVEAELADELAVVRRHLERAAADGADVPFEVA